MEKDALWRKVINSKYKMEGLGWVPNMELNRKVFNIWRDIMQVQTRQPQMFETFMENAKLKVGDGRTILFWKDIWLGTTTLSSLFPTLYGILNNNEEKLSDVLARKDVSFQWDFDFRRSLYDWESVSLTELRNLLDNSGVAASFDSPDKLVWQGCASGRFSVKSIYNLAVSSSSNQDIIFDLIWKNIAPPRVQCFGWLAYLGKVKTSEFLLRIGILHSEVDALCRFCKANI